ncbi:MAG: glycerol-3-phosphate ABC transporter ATP-binding protein [Ignavibacteriae bacterium HGW-Ignavibacteriae-2]|jgi:multiple sugar transport system ATP-binding protein|nr:MAG: glycerol-3-phosphate ABC transporter ATP-binding protein [Ignavibacteriae bacterium HGW-Ignavibacteriae-2]
MAEVILKNLSKSYDGKSKAVNDVNIKINDKEFVVLVGPSGCGKSTTLRMVAGLEDISGGEILIDGKVVNDISPKDRDIAMVFQNYALYPHMTVFENMAFGLKLRKFPKSEILNRVQEAAKILDIENFLERKPKALSGGQRQRVAVGRAIVRKPKVFLFDEPLSNLDAKLRVQMRTEISKLHKKLEATMIYVTHDQTEAMTMGDKIVVMKDGFVQQIDSPLKLYNNPVNKFVAGFIGSPSMNFIDGKIIKNTKLLFQSVDGKDTIELSGKYSSKLESYLNKNIILGFRPEDIQIKNTESGNLSRHSIKLEVVEPMGNEIFIYFLLGNAEITGRVPADTILKVDDVIDVFIDKDKLHFFDADDQKSIVD